MIHNLPVNFRFVEYSAIWSYSASPAHKKDIQVNLLAQAEDDEHSLIGEVKNRKAKFSLKEAKEFFDKASEVKTLENIPNAAVFVFSASGFHKNAMAFLEKNQMAWSDDQRFLE